MVIGWFWYCCNRCLWVSICIVLGCCFCWDVDWLFLVFIFGVQNCFVFRFCFVCVIFCLKCVCLFLCGIRCLDLSENEFFLLFVVVVFSFVGTVSLCCFWWWNCNVGRWCWYWVVFVFVWLLWCWFVLCRFLFWVGLFRIWYWDDWCWFVLLVFCCCWVW